MTKLVVETQVLPRGSTPNWGTGLVFSGMAATMTLATQAVGFLTLPIALAYFGLGLKDQAVSDPPPKGRTLHGEIRMIPPGRPFNNADLIVTIEDVSVQDTSARPIGQLKKIGVSYDGQKGSVLKFTMDGLKPPANARCQIRVLIDVNHDGRISAGDYRTTKATPVFTDKDKDPVIAEVEMKQQDNKPNVGVEAACGVGVSIN